MQSQDDGLDEYDRNLKEVREDTIEMLSLAAKAKEFEAHKHRLLACEADVAASNLHELARSVTDSLFYDADAVIDYYARMDQHTNALRLAVEHAVLVDGKHVDGEFLDLLREVVENAADDDLVKDGNETAIKRLAESESKPGVISLSS